MILATFCTLLLAAPLTSSTAMQPEAEPAPQVLRLDNHTPNMHVRIDVEPGVAQKNQPVFMRITLTQPLPAQHTLYDTETPISNAHITAYVLHAPKSTFKDIQSDTAVQTADEGVYQLMLEPTQTEIATLVVRVTVQNKTEQFVQLLPIDTWPYSEQSPQASLPKTWPAASAYALKHGEQLCQRYCTQVPSMISGNQGNVPSATLLQHMLKPTAPALQPIEQRNLMAYLKTKYTSLEQLFPQANASIQHVFTLNEYAQERLTEALPNVSFLTESPITVLYRASENVPYYIDYNNRHARSMLQHKQKLGYVVFLPFDEHTEIAMALRAEPSFAIEKLWVRSNNAQADAKLNQQLASYIGKGAFHQPQSLGPNNALTQRLRPLYLFAAELATAYSVDERDFSAFDAEFSTH